MTETAPAYGLWSLVILNSLVFIVFAFSFFKPQTQRDWRSFGAFAAFLVALFTEMYGFPLTIYFLSGWLQSRFPEVDWLTHDAGHLLEMMFGWRANPHWGPFHVLSMLFIGGGFWLLAAAWPVLYAAQGRASAAGGRMPGAAAAHGGASAAGGRMPGAAAAHGGACAAQMTHTLATIGPYAYVRHPQYAAFVLIMFGFLLQWPTILTLLMFPVLVYMYVLLARREEAEAHQQFGESYARYAATTPAFVPRLRALLGA